MALEDEKYICVTTFRRSGLPVASPTWVAPLDGGRFGFWTSSASGKLKRLRNDPKITVQPCDSRGKVTAGSTVTSGTAVVLSSGPEFDRIQREIRSKYRAMVPISKLFNAIGHIGKGRSPYGDVVVVVTPDS